MYKRYVALICLLNNQLLTDQIVRKDFFQNIVGMSETEFRETFSWSYYKSLDCADTTLRNYLFEKNPRSAAIFQGSCYFISVEQLRIACGQKAIPLSTEPLFKVFLYDPLFPEKSNMRNMQADDSYKYAFFQIESTFWGPLEKNIYAPDIFLQHMLKNPAKGEELCVSTAPATIYRKYFMSYNPIPAKDTRYLLSNLFDKLPYLWIDSQTYRMNLQAINAYQFDPHDMEKIKIALHERIVVSSGYASDTTPEGIQPQLEIYCNNDHTIDVEKTQLVSHAFSATLDTRLLVDNNHVGLKDGAKRLAQILQDASYEATIRAAFLAGQKNVVLVLMGARSPYNEMTWILHALKKMEHFITQKGMQITLIYRPDKYRLNGDQHAGRSVETDFIFLKGILQMAARINKKKSPNDSLIFDYLQQAYSFEKIYAQNPAAIAPKEYVGALEALKNALDY